ncbi:MAG TPA: beta galactosidase jelly roll domain-containing protein, partial [Fimbriimonadaceae bacterium]|nr:beta galactosidase jelly roll domain-containing protein [Fimbriimonadaceae bacterium]
MIRSLVSLVLLVLALPTFASSRVERELAKGWRFVKQDATGAEATGFDDSAWEKVTLPHTWNVKDGADGGTYYRGPGWYRLHLDIGPELAGDELFLRFGAASLVADVYVNGRLAGHHEGGFAAFCFDVTKLANPGDNVVAVRVDNALNKNVTPLSGDFTVYGGLYREVKLIALDPVHISPLDDASCGVYLTPKVTDQQATVAIKTKLWNDRHDAQAVEVRTQIVDAHNNAVGSADTTVQVPAGAGADGDQTITIANPHLWNGAADPYLYRAEVVLVNGGRVTDEVD